MSEVARTARLSLGLLGHDDAAFVLRLLNEPSFLEHIGDRGVRTHEDALRYLDDGPMASYARHGYGLFAVRLAGSGEPIGMCGLLRRDGLPEPDIGFAFLPEHCGRGYAFEAATAVLQLVRERFAVEIVLAIVSPANRASQALLRRLGFVEHGTVRLAADAADLLLYRLGPPG